MRSFVAQMRRVKPHQETWAVNDKGLFLLDSFELSALSQDQRLSLAERIERIGQALTAEELAKILNVSRITIFKHAAAGRIPSFRIGTLVRFDPKMLAAWLK